MRMNPPATPRKRPGLLLRSLIEITIVGIYSKSYGFWIMVLNVSSLTATQQRTSWNMRVREPEPQTSTTGACLTCHPKPLDLEPVLVWPYHVALYYITFNGLCYVVLY